MKPEISRETLDTIIDYIERVEVQIDGEWGSCQSLTELIQANEMPSFYDELKMLRERIFGSKAVRLNPDSIIPVRTTSK